MVQWQLRMRQFAKKMPWPFLSETPAKRCCLMFNFTPRKSIKSSTILPQFFKYLYITVIICHHMSSQSFRTVITVRTFSDVHPCYIMLYPCSQSESLNVGCQRRKSRGQGEKKAQRHASHATEAVGSAADGELRLGLWWTSGSGRAAWAMKRLEESKGYTIWLWHSQFTMENHHC